MKRRKHGTPCSTLNPMASPIFAGSEHTPVTTGVTYSRFQASENGFMYFSMNATRLQVKAVSFTGAVWYQMELNK